MSSDQTKKRRNRSKKIRWMRQSAFEKGGKKAPPPFSEEDAQYDSAPEVSTEQFTSVRRQQDLEQASLEKKRKRKHREANSQQYEDEEGEFAEFRPEYERWIGENDRKYNAGADRYMTKLQRERLKKLPPTQEELNREYQKLRDRMKDKRSVHDKMLEDFYYEMKNDDLVRAAFNAFMPLLIGSGITLEIKGLGDAVDLSNISSNFTNVEMFKFTYDWWFLQLCWGFAVCSGSPSKYLPNMDKPVIVRKSLWTTEFGYTDHEREWLVFKKDTPGNAAGSARGGGESVHQIMEDAFVSSLFPPNDDGSLSSPLWVLAPKIREYRKIWNNISHAIDSNAHPEYLVEVAHPGGSSGNRSALGARGSVGAFTPATSTLFTDGDLLGMDQQHESEMNEHDREEFMMAKAIAKALNSGVVKLNRSANSEEMEQERIRAERSERNWHNPIVLPRGQRVTTAPEAKLAPQVQEFVNMIVVLFCAEIGIPYHMLVTDSRMHAANAELEQRNVNSRTKYEQRRGGPELTEVLKEVWQDELNQLREERKEIWRQEREDSDEYKALQEIAEEKDIRMLESLIESHEMEEVTVEVRFNHTPVTSQDRLTHLWEKRIISHETFAKHSLTVNGLSIRDMAPKEEREAFMREENELRKAQVEQAKMSVENMRNNMQQQQQQQQTPNTPKVGEKRKRDSESLASEYDTTPSDESKGLKKAEQNRMQIEKRIEK